MTREAPSPFALAALAFAGLAGAFAVALAAGAAHWLAEDAARIADIAARYALAHAAALLGAAALLDRLPEGAARKLGLLAVSLLIAGVTLFSGGLAAHAYDIPIAGIAPVGGVLLIAGWIACPAAALAAVLRRR